MLPKPLEEKPEPLREDLQEVLDCFWLLADSRPVGFGSASGVTTVDVLAMASAFRFRADWFLAVIRQLDRVFLAHLHEAAAKASRKGKP